MARRVRTKYNWPMVKQVYILGKLNPETGASEDYTYTELAAMFNIKSDSSVKRRADREDWHTERERRKKQDEATLKRKLEEMKAAELPDLVEIRRRLLKGQLGILAKGLQQLDAGEMEIKPIDIHRASEFIIQEYHTLFGIAPTPAVVTDEQPQMIQINIGDIDDLYDRANNIRRKRVV